MLKRSLYLLLSLLLALLLSACSLDAFGSPDGASVETTQVMDAETSASDRSETASAPPVADREELLYYVALVEDLQEELQRLKAENFILSSLLGSGNEPSETDASLSPSLPYTYELDDGEITILSYTGTEKVVTIPDTLDGYPVTEIGERAFADTGIEAVTLPAAVEEIGWFAFLNCYALRSITAGSALTEIGYGAFDGCSSSLTLICPAGSYLARYGHSFGLAVKHS